MDKSGILPFFRWVSAGAAAKDKHLDGEGVSKPYVPVDRGDSWGEVTCILCHIQDSLTDIQVVMS